MALAVEEALALVDAEIRKAVRTSPSAARVGFLLPWPHRVAVEAEIAPDGVIVSRRVSCSPCGQRYQFDDAEDGPRARQVLAAHVGCR
jgi:hypothetical protein